MSNFFSRVREVIKGWKTVIFHSLYGSPAALFLIYTEFKSSGVDVTQFVPAKYAALAGLVIAVIGIALRLATTGPISSKAGLKTSDDAFDTEKPL